MTIGLGTYALFWEWSAHNPSPITLNGMLRRAHELSVELFQICDYPQIEEMSRDDLVATRAMASSLGINLELGTRGVETAHLLRYLDIAELLGARMLRSMIQLGAGQSSLEDSAGYVRELVPELERRGIVLALETYEQIATADLLRVVTRADSASVGICLDPGNTVAAMEHPMAVVRACSDHVLNLHVKDFAFSRRDGWVGFTFAGVPLGGGLLDYDAMVSVVRPEERGINRIIEHWLPWQGDITTTVAMERQWTEHNLDYLRSKK